MLLGKRSRPPMKRTTSMTEFAADLAPPPPPEHEMALHRAARRGGRRSSADCAAVVETAPFLSACGLCNRRLGPGRDIFMYRGEIAFCSLECRQQQMSLDERKEKCSVSSMKKD